MDEGKVSSYTPAMNDKGKVKIHFLIWPSILLSIVLTLLLNLIFGFFS